MLALLTALPHPSVCLSRSPSLKEETRKNSGSCVAAVRGAAAGVAGAGRAGRAGAGAGGADCTGVGGAVDADADAGAGAATWAKR